MSEASNLIIIFAFSILVSYFGGLFSPKTKIPDIIWLLVFGVTLGPGFHLVDPVMLNSVAPLIGSISLTLITFEAGLGTDIDVLRDTLEKSLALTLLTLLVLITGISLISRYVIPGFSVLQGLLLGVMLCGISTVAIVSIFDHIKNLVKEIDSSRVILVFESTVGKPIQIVLALTIINIMTASQISGSASILNIVQTFAVSLAIGLALGVASVIALYVLRRRRFDYMLTLSIVFLGYFGGEYFAGSGGGTIVSFICGLLLANPQIVEDVLGRRLRFHTDKIQTFNTEVSFLIKSYYFVYLGVVSIFSYQLLIAGLFITVAIIVLRYIVANVLGFFYQFTSIEKIMISLSFPLGESAIVFSQLPLIYGKGGLNVSIYTPLVFQVVLGTVVFSSFVMPIILNHQLNPKNSES
jgi:cell volume regulation protein A